MRKNIKILLTATITIFILLGFAVPVNMVGNWYQQFMPNLNGKQISDITFIDSLNGYAVATQTSDSSYILKTTNGGDNWQIIHRQLFAMTHVQFLNLSTGFAGGGYLYKTIDGGFNWNQINTPASTVEKMFILNDTTFWYVNSESLTGGIYFTSNGGASWTRQLDLGSQNPNHVYFYNGRLGFIGKDNVYLRRTSDGGLNWNIVPGENGLTDMHFVDSLTGWKASGNMKKTTDGGLNWILQTLPQGGNIVISQIVKFDNTARDTIWGIGSTIMTGSGNRGMILRTTNSGNNWLFQVPDSTINIFQYQHIQFSTLLIGWAYTGSSGVHTTMGGDPVWYTGIVKSSNNIPIDFELKQNYPNPFNPRTVIPYKLKKSAYVKLIAYDLLGRECQKLVDKKQQAGEYEVDFMGKFTSSGVYFYSLIIDGKLIDTKKMLMVK